MAETKESRRRSLLPIVEQVIWNPYRYPRKFNTQLIQCPQRVAQLASLCLGVAHVAIITIAGFGGFKKILDEFLTPEGASVDDVRELYLTSDINRSAIDELCAEPFNLSRSLFLQGAPIYYFGTDPPFGNTLGKHALVTTIASLRDPFLDSIEEEDKMYEELAGSKLHYIGPMIGDPGMLRASTHKAAWTEEERSLLVEYNKHPHRRRSMLRPSADDDKLLNIVKKAKSLGRRICLVTLGTVVTSDRAAFGWHGTGLGVSITGKELVQSVVNAAIDELGLKDDDNIDSSISADESKAPLLVLTVGQQPDALDGIVLPANAIARASVPQIDILRCMNSDDLFVHHGGQNSTMEVRTP
ncbi:hypothetical protein THAOC_00041 [Thalassiosira oceanica]|uniref:Uncharacterized protein n=1 Tax=Thalassiosira oceanica TaxID=159749 RepID=K3W4K1_THAOC|nr:hypothetical protein THAOC_00041 [Thalassiosira oceanica]|eukprot:EJK78079.1 hypothetical protein THAOC_00041 [Thalassiosira oceanica]